MVEGRGRGGPRLAVVQLIRILDGEQVRHVRRGREGLEDALWCAPGGARRMWVGLSVGN